MLEPLAPRSLPPITGDGDESPPSPTRKKKGLSLAKRLAQRKATEAQQQSSKIVENLDKSELEPQVYNGRAHMTDLSEDASEVPSSENLLGLDKTPVAAKPAIVAEPTPVAKTTLTEQPKPIAEDTSVAELRHVAEDEPASKALPAANSEVTAPTAKARPIRVKEPPVADSPVAAAKLSLKEKPAVAETCSVVNDSPSFDIDEPGSDSQPRVTTVKPVPGVESGSGPSDQSKDEDGLLSEYPKAPPKPARRPLPQPHPSPGSIQSSSESAKLTDQQPNPEEPAGKSATNPNQSVSSAFTGDIGIQKEETNSADSPTREGPDAQPSVSSAPSVTHRSDEVPDLQAAVKSDKQSMKEASEESDSPSAENLTGSDEEYEEDEFESDVESDDDTVAVKKELMGMYNMETAERAGAESPASSVGNTPSSSATSTKEPASRGWEHVRNTLSQPSEVGSSIWSASSTSSALYTQDIKSARHRNFIVGHLGPTSSLLGTGDLERLFPERKLQLFVGTWNIGEQKDIPSDLADFILPNTIEFVPDMYAIGVQENSADRLEWEIKLQEVIGLHHVLFESIHLGALHLAIFLKRDLIWYCSVAEGNKVLTRMYTPVSTKGAVAVCFTLFGTSFLFITSHFTAHDGNVEERIDDYKVIKKGINLPRRVVQNQYLGLEEDTTARFDCVFWFGDLNFRVTKDKQFVEKVIGEERKKEYPRYEALIANDELTIAMNDGRIFEAFSEGRITFPPTYKFDLAPHGSQASLSGAVDVYDSSPKARVPSYTDRILFRSKKKNHITCTQYLSAQEIRSSDHRPVYGIYDIFLKPGSDSIPLAGGRHNQEVYQEALHRRALHRVVAKLHPKIKKKKKKRAAVAPTASKGVKTSAVCSVM